MDHIFGKRLNELRLERKMSRKELAKNLFVSERLICYWENGNRECNSDMLITLAKFFGVTTDYILGLEY